jgi:hypothetical protein
MLSSIFKVLAHQKQQFMDRHVATLGLFILIPNQPVFALSPEFCVLSREATNTHFSLWFDPIGARTHDLPHSREYTDHYTIDDVQNIFL